MPKFEKFRMNVDKFIIPFEKFYEKFITLPFGLSLTGVLEKKHK